MTENRSTADNGPDTICFMTERIEVQRTIPAPAADIFSVLCDPQGHVAIDASGMLQAADGDPVQAVGDNSCTWTARRSTTIRWASTTSPSPSASSTRTG
jgi:hypothetical protein